MNDRKLDEGSFGLVEKKKKTKKKLVFGFICLIHQFSQTILLVILSKFSIEICQKRVTLLLK